MHFKEISQPSGVDGWDEDFAENGLISVLVFRYFAAPQGPLVLFHAPVIIVAESAFREFYLDQ